MLLLMLQRQLTHTIAAIVTPIVAFLTAIITPAGFAMTGNTQGMGIVLLGGQRTSYTPCPPHQDTYMETPPS